jgi:hypothetical protein
MVGYLLNDTHGMAGVAFTFVSAAMLYPALVLLARTPDEPGEAIPGETEPAGTATDVGMTGPAADAPEPAGDEEALPEPTVISEDRPDPDQDR